MKDDANWRKDEREEKTIGLVRWIFEHGDEEHKSSASCMMELAYLHQLKVLDGTKRVLFERYQRPC